MMEKKAIVEFDETAAALAELRDKYSEFKKPTDTKSSKQLAVGIKDLRDRWLMVDKVRLGETKGYRDHIAEVNKRGNGIITELKQMAEPMIAAKLEYEEAKAAAKAAKEAAELKRVTDIKERIAAILQPVDPFLTAAQIQACIDELEATVIDETFEEFQDNAATAKASAVDAAKAVLEKVQERERVEADQAAEAQRLADEREALEKERADQEAEQKAEADRLAKEQAKIDQERAEVEAAKQAEIDRKAKEAAAAAELKAETERKMAAKAEAERLKPDRDKLLSFAEMLEAIDPPVCGEPEGQKVVKLAMRNLHETAQNIRDRLAVVGVAA